MSLAIVPGVHTGTPFERTVGLGAAFPVTAVVAAMLGAGGFRKDDPADNCGTKSDGCTAATITSPVAALATVSTAPAILNLFDHRCLGCRCSRRRQFRIGLRTGRDGTRR
jgi:hypothetical protein